MYRIQKSSYMGDRFVLELNEASGQTHETVWKETESVLREMKKHSLSRSDEDVVLTNILEMLQSLKSTFPSHLRNAVNYQLPYGMDAIEHKIYPAYTVTKTNKWLDPLFTFDPKKKYSIVEQLPLFKAYILYCDRRGILDL